MAHLKSSIFHQPSTPIGVHSPVTETKQPPVYRNRMETWKSQNYPSYTPPRDEEILSLYRARGWTDPARCFEDYNRVQDEALDRSGGALHMIGFPPAEGETDIYVYPIPNSSLSIRIWPGGMTRYGQYCLEFYDMKTSKTVNTPDGFKICGFARPGMFQYEGPLVSWERAFDRHARLPEGCEKYSVPEGSHLRLVRRGHEDFLFMIPTRPAPQFAAPTPFVRQA